MRLCADGGIVTTKKKSKREPCGIYQKRNWNRLCGMWALLFGMRPMTAESVAHPKWNKPLMNPNPLSRKRDKRRRPIDIREVCITKEGKEPSQWDAAPLRWVVTIPIHSERREREKSSIREKIRVIFSLSPSRPFFHFRAKHEYTSFSRLIVCLLFSYPSIIFFSLSDVRNRVVVVVEWERHVIQDLPPVKMTHRRHPRRRRSKTFSLFLFVYV